MARRTHAPRHISHVVSTDCMQRKEKGPCKLWAAERFCDSGSGAGLYTTPTKRREKEKKSFIARPFEQKTIFFFNLAFLFYLLLSQIDFPIPPPHSSPSSTQLASAQRGSSIPPSLYRPERGVFPLRDSEKLFSARFGGGGGGGSVSTF